MLLSRCKNSNMLISRDVTRCPRYNSKVFIAIILCIERNWS